jgi:pyridoxine 5-phosphate synthase
MVRLSVNVNKVATIRNSRGGAAPSVVHAARTCVQAGAGGITLHPRADRRHITPEDVTDVRDALADHWGDTLELNLEGDPRPEWLDLVVAARPSQATLVPVSPGEITSNAGWRPAESRQILDPAIERLHGAGIRISLFVDPTPEAVEWAAELGADRVELYTEPYARAAERGTAEAEQSFQTYRRAAERAHAVGLGINAGHDLDLDNLVLFRTLPHLDEVSIGHALISRALFVGLERCVKDYLAVLGERPSPAS